MHTISMVITQPTTDSLSLSIDFRGIEIANIKDISLFMDSVSEIVTNILVGTITEVINISPEPEKNITPATGKKFAEKIG